MVCVSVSGGDDGVPGRGLMELLQSERHADLSLVLEGKVLRVHRLILASQCAYFDRSAVEHDFRRCMLNYTSVHHIQGLNIHLGMGGRI